MKLHLICVGKLSGDYLPRGVDDYSSRIRRYLPLEITELREEKAGRKPDPRQLREKEAERVLARIPERAFVVLLDEQGKSLPSEGLADLLEHHMVQGTEDFVWVIGGPYGLGDRLRQRGNYLLSLSRLTFTHQMARLILLEQIYRGLTIVRNEPYHNR